ncbi:hypothetical protein ACIOWM_23070 [Streptomyces anulatus]
MAEAVSYARLNPYRTRRLNLPVLPVAERPPRRRPPVLPGGRAAGADGKTPGTGRPAAVRLADMGSYRFYFFR